jgi:hypothetical protein
MSAFAANPYDGYQVIIANGGQVTSVEQIGPDTPTSGNPDFSEPPG